MANKRVWNEEKLEAKLLVLKEQGKLSTRQAGKSIVNACTRDYGSWRNALEHFGIKHDIPEPISKGINGKQPHIREAMELDIRLATKNADELFLLGVIGDQAYVCWEGANEDGQWGLNIEKAFVWNERLVCSYGAYYMDHFTEELTKEDWELIKPLQRK